MDGTILLTATDDATAKLWSVESGECTQTFAGHDGTVMSAVFSADGASEHIASRDLIVMHGDVEGLLTHCRSTGCSFGSVDKGIVSALGVPADSQQGERRGLLCSGETADRRVPVERRARAARNAPRSLLGRHYGSSTIG